MIMKIFTTICGIFTFSAGITSQLKASTIVIDSFTEAGFELAGGPGGLVTTTNKFLSPLAGSRIVIVRGSGGWTGEFFFQVRINEA
jgi:hypothetical protein